MLLIEEITDTEEYCGEVEIFEQKPSILGVKF